MVPLLGRPQGRTSEGASDGLRRLDAQRRLCRVRQARPRRPGPRDRLPGACAAQTCPGLDPEFFDVHAAQGSAIAAEALERIAALYAVEKEARGQPPDRRVAIRGAKAGPRLDDLERWLQTQLPRVSAKTPLAAAIRYALTRLKRLRPYLEHGFLEIDNNPAERAIRPIALGRKNYLFMGSAAGGKAAAIACTLIETAKLNDIDPQAWLAEVLDRIPDYKINRVDELLPWNCPATAQPTADI